jgi:hypothetical protein
MPPVTVTAPPLGLSCAAAGALAPSRAAPQMSEIPSVLADPINDIEFLRECVAQRRPPPLRKETFRNRNRRSTTRPPPPA